MRVRPCWNADGHQTGSAFGAVVGAQLLPQSAGFDSDDRIVTRIESDLDAKVYGRGARNQGETVDVRSQQQFSGRSPATRWRIRIPEESAAAAGLDLSGLSQIQLAIRYGYYAGAFARAVTDADVVAS